MPTNGKMVDQTCTRGKSKRQLQCRLCGRFNYSALKNVFQCRVKLPCQRPKELKTYDLVPLVRLVNECLDIEVMENCELPVHVCKLCYNQLISWSTFKDNCLKQQKKFETRLTGNVCGDDYQTDVAQIKQVELNHLSAKMKQQTEIIDKDVLSNTSNFENSKLSKESDFLKEKNALEESGVTGVNSSGKENDCLGREQGRADVTAVDATSSVTVDNNLASSSVSRKISSCSVNKKAAMKNTLRISLPKKGSPHECDKCHKVFSTNIALRAHSETHNEGQPYCCHICGMLFRTSAYLQRHVRLHSLNRNKYCCSYCDAEYTQLNHLKHHIRIHTGEKPYKCKECEQKFLRKHQLTVHLSSVHKKEKKYICDLCGKGFQSNANFKAHMLRHSGQRNMKCNVCSKSFVTKNALFRHQRLHTGEKPFVCQECGKRFADSSNKKKHIISNHSGIKVNKRRGSRESDQNPRASSTLEKSQTNRKGDGNSKSGNNTVVGMNEVHAVTASPIDTPVVLLASSNSKSLEEFVNDSSLNYKNGEVYLDVTNIPVINQDDLIGTNLIQLPNANSSSNLLDQPLNKYSGRYVNEDTASLEVANRLEAVPETDRLEDLLIFSSDNVPENTAYFIPDKEIFTQPESLAQYIQSENLSLSQADVESDYLDLGADQQKTSNVVDTATSFDAQSILKILNDGGTVLMFSEQNDLSSRV